MGKITALQKVTDPLGYQVTKAAGLVPGPAPLRQAQLDIYQQGQQALNAEDQLAQQQVNSYGNYGSQADQLNTNLLGQSLFGSGYTGSTSDQNAQFASNQQQLLQQLNPNFYNQANTVTAAANNYANLQEDPNGYNAQLQQQAQSLLDQGGNLSPSELRLTQQASIGGYSSRGLDATNASIADETLQTDTAYRNRLAENLGLSTTLNSAASSNYLSGLNAQQAGLTAQQQAYFDPSTYTNDFLTNAMGMNQMQSQISQQQFNPYTAGINDFYNTNFNANAASNIANQNASAGQTSAGIQAGAGLAGTALLVF